MKEGSVGVADEEEVDKQQGRAPSGKQNVQRLADRREKAWGWTGRSHSHGSAMDMMMQGSKLECKHTAAIDAGLSTDQQPFEHSKWHPRGSDVEPEEQQLSMQTQVLSSAKQEGK
eukprot:1160755-Pelagomonas_calceolata.AAC.11